MLQSSSFYDQTGAPNPYYQGLRVVDKDDLFPKGFSRDELTEVYNSLVEGRHEEGLALEAPTLEELEYFNPGEEEISDTEIFEAITVDRFSRTEKRMSAVVRVLNRHLEGTEIRALPPIVGRPKKTAAFAYVIVQLPFSDGQTVNVVFHAPEADKKKITPSDTIIAFRWLLNKRDITHVVAPEDGQEVSLQTIAKRVSQLVVKNSARFERQQKVAQAERKELEQVREAVKEADTRQRELMDQVAGKAKEESGLEAQLSNTLALLEKQKAINAELQVKIDAFMKNASASGTGTPQPTPAPDKNTKNGEEPDGTTPTPPPSFVTDLNDILAGKYDGDTARVLELLERAIDEAEKQDKMAEYGALLDDASNRLTDLLAKEAQ